MAAVDTTMPQGVKLERDCVIILWSETDLKNKRKDNIFSARLVEAVLNLERTTKKKMFGSPQSIASFAISHLEGPFYKLQLGP
ncbi:hypothetical protein NC651_032136 [Populus alba x Populus x berolinensis]|nr:hypothetical protein NC651_032136 [Populus alba x Populus x berolinensis]